jgi:hydrogenase maturation protease
MLEKVLGEKATVRACAAHGLELLDQLAGFQNVVIVDAIKTGQHAPGTILEVAIEDLDSIVAPSPHFAGIPELKKVAQHLGLTFPSDVRIFAIEAQQVDTINEELTLQVAAALPEIAEIIIGIVNQWENANQLTK